MKKIRLIMMLGVFMINTTAVFAQKGQARNMSAEDIAKRQNQFMFENISNLSDQQKQEIEALNLKFAEKMLQARNENFGDRTAMRGKMTELRDAKLDEIQKILDDPQYQELLKAQQQNQKRRGGGRGRPS